LAKLKRLDKTMPSKPSLMGFLLAGGFKKKKRKKERLKKS